MRILNIVLLGLSSLLAQAEMHFAAESFPPFSYLEKGQVTGASVELVMAACHSAHLDCQFKIYPWRRALISGRKGEVDALVSVAKNIDRESWLNFSESILETSYGWFVQAEDENPYQSLQDLRGYRIVVYGPSNLSRTVKYLRNRVAGLKTSQTLDTPTSLRKVALGNMHEKMVAFVNKEVAEYWIRKMSISNLKYLGGLESVTYHVGFPRGKVEQDVIAKFNQGLREVKSSSQYQKILKNYSIVSNL